ncbi:hypothetical protein ATK86_4912 [Nocardia fluminea]|uniref:Uncharacterized protein n=1 Tax=Nocardia fluminea TaxID=134984 RepID=A0A2N3VFT3_9NOCA|nr:hypothetical protein ATK86_4912 [Nocardia fluminea]
MNNGGRSPCPDEPDIRLSVELSGVRIYFAACLTAALVFVCDVAARRPGTVAVYPGHCAGLPRLPNERRAPRGAAIHIGGGMTPK